MSHGHPGLTPYQAAYLAGGPARVAETATVELIRQGRLAVSRTGLAVVGPGRPAGSRDSPDGGTGQAAAGPRPLTGEADPLTADVEQLIVGLASAADGGLRLPGCWPGPASAPPRRAAASWPIRRDWPVG